MSNHSISEEALTHGIRVVGYVGSIMGMVFGAAFGWNWTIGLSAVCFVLAVWSMIRLIKSL